MKELLATNGRCEFANVSDCVKTFALWSSEPLCHKKLKLRAIGVVISRCVKSQLYRFRGSTATGTM